MPPELGLSQTCGCSAVAPRISEYGCVFPVFVYFITTVFQQMAFKCLEEEAPFSYSHRSPDVKSLESGRTRRLMEQNKKRKQS